MRIAIVGVGGIGGYFGGKLALHYASHETIQVIFIARGGHLEKIKEKGLKIITVEGEFVAKPAIATDDPKDVGSLDLVIFAVKGYDLEPSARMVTPNLNPQSVVIPLLNGVASTETLRAVLPQSRILNGCVYISTHRVEPGVVHQVGGPCLLLFGPEDGGVDAYGGIEKTLKDAGIKAELRSDIKVAVWEKYIFVSPMASVTSLYRKTLGDMLRDNESRNLFEGLTRELKMVSDAKGILLPPNIVEISMGKASNFPYETKSSMQLDFEKGNKTELDIFTGYVIKASDALGIEVPLYRMVYEKLKRS
ncbi:MAG: 2-dehydropantoate 2-reductase [Pseudomonadota bacterium]